MTAETIAKALGGRKASGGWMAKCPAHDDRSPSLSLRDADNNKVLVYCHAGCPQRAIIDRLKERGLWPIGERSSRHEKQTKQIHRRRPVHGPAPKQEQKEPIIPLPDAAPAMTFKHPKHGAPSKAWPYRLAGGELAGYIARFDFVKNDGTPGKDYRPLTFCDLGGGRRGWRSKGLPAPRPLYRLPDLLARPQAPVLVVEGEKSADAALALFPEYTATTAMHGAKSPSLTDWSPLKGRTVTIWPDYDRAGAAFAQTVARLANEAGAAAIVLVPVPADFPDGWDLADEAPDGWTSQQLRRLLEAAEPWRAHADTSRRRREIRCRGGDLADATEAAISALAAEPDPMQAVYVRGGQLVVASRARTLANAAIRRPMDALVLRAIDVDWLRLRLAQIADYYLPAKEKGEAIAIDPPVRLCRSVLAAQPWPRLPALTGVIEAPTIRLDGSLLTAPGYDAATGLLFDPGHTHFPPIPEWPTRGEAVAALKILREPFQDFAVVDEAARSVVLSAVLTMLVRRLLRAAPLYAIDAPKMASGKTLLATMLSYIASGRGPYLMTQVAEPAEERKRLLAALIEGPLALVIDNVEQALKSEALCVTLSEPTFTDRLLGVSRLITAPTNCCLFATGNNLRIAGDLSARSLICRIDPRVERPEERVFARDLHAWVPAHRGELVAAALTIIRAYCIAGEPKPDVPNFARFEEWQRLCRYPLIWLGCADPCVTRQRIERADPERQKLQVLLQAWRDQFGEERVTVKRAIQAGANSESLQAAIDAVAGEKSHVNARRLGNFLSKHQHRIEGGLRFEQDGGRGGIAYWRVREERG